MLGKHNIFVLVFVTENPNRWHVLTYQGLKDNTQVYELVQFIQ